MFYLTIVNKILRHCHSWLARQNDQNIGFKNSIGGSREDGVRFRIPPGKIQVAICLLRDTGMDD